MGKLLIRPDMAALLVEGEKKASYHKEKWSHIKTSNLFPTSRRRKKMAQKIRGCYGCPTRHRLDSTSALQKTNIH